MGKNKSNDNRPDFEVWVYGLGGQQVLEAAVKSGEVQKVQMKRHNRERNSPSMAWPVDVELAILGVAVRRKRGAHSTHQELAVTARMMKDAPRGVLNSLDDGRGLSDFKAGTEFELVVWSDDTQAARVSRSSEVLRAG